SMIKNMKRREVIKVAAIAAGGLLAMKATAAPKNTNTSLFAGEWFYQGQPCAIFQQGGILLVVNEGGALATPHITGPPEFVSWGGAGWDSGLVAEVVNSGAQINWSNGTVWTRA